MKWVSTIPSGGDGSSAIRHLHKVGLTPTSRRSLQPTLARVSFRSSSAAAWRSGPRAAAEAALDLSGPGAGCEDVDAPVKLLVRGPDFGGHCKMLTARAITSPRMNREVIACTVMAALAQRASGITSVGLKAVALVKPR